MCSARLVSRRGQVAQVPYTIKAINNECKKICLEHVYTYTNPESELKVGASSIATLCRTDPSNSDIR